MRSFKFILVVVTGLMMCSQELMAQKSYYTVMQIGGQFGVNNEGYEGSYNGYAVHFIFGQNFSDRAFVGIGVGNETFRGAYRPSGPAQDQTERNYDAYMMPIFVDGRLPVGYFGQNSRFGFVANAGYAPKIGPVYDKGFLVKGGLFYLYESLRTTNFTASLTYGYQELSNNIHNRAAGFQHQHVNVSVGIMLK